MTLTEKAIEAKRLGMSYGQYVAKYHPQKVKPRARESSDPEGAYKMCVVCGKRLTGHKTKYYSDKCAKEHRKRKRAAGEWPPRNRRG